MPNEPQTPSLALDDLAVASAIESILFVAGGPVTVSALATALSVPRHRIQTGLRLIDQRLNEGVQLQVDRNAAQLVSSPQNNLWIRRYLGTAPAPSLSRGALETLAVIAYRQPVTRAEIEVARGVNSDRAVQTLLARNLVEELGQRDTLGRPMQYGTGFGFLEYFGLGSLEDLPPLAGAGESNTSLEPGVLGMLAPATATAEQSQD